MFIYHYLFTSVLKSPDGDWPITYTLLHCYIDRMFDGLQILSNTTKHGEMLGRLDRPLGETFKISFSEKLLTYLTFFQ